MTTVFIENTVLKYKRVGICSPLSHITFFNYLLKKYNLLYITIIYYPYIVTIICTIKGLFQISCLLFIQDAFPAVKNPKKSPQKCLISISNPISVMLRMDVPLIGKHPSLFFTEQFSLAAS